MLEQFFDELTVIPSLEVESDETPLAFLESQYERHLRTERGPRASRYDPGVGMMPILGSSSLVRQLRRGSPFSTPAGRKAPGPHPDLDN